MALKEKIRAARMEAGLSQGDLAEKVGCTKRSISYWETTSRQPDFNLLAKIAEATGKTLDYFAA